VLASALFYHVFEALDYPHNRCGSILHTGECIPVPNANDVSTTLKHNHPAITAHACTMFSSEERSAREEFRQAEIDPSLREAADGMVIYLSRQTLKPK
jgi:hypothetical protein